VEQLHHEKHGLRLVVVIVVEDADDPRVRDSIRDVPLAEEPLGGCPGPC
jgi:hypothetical protein